MALARYSHVPLLTRIWQFRHNMWPYDPAYVALAESLGADLVTVDGTIEKIPGIQCTVLTRVARALTSTDNTGATQ